MGVKNIRYVNKMWAISYISHREKLIKCSNEQLKQMLSEHMINSDSMSRIECIDYIVDHINICNNNMLENMLEQFDDHKFDNFIITNENNNNEAWE